MLSCLRNKSNACPKKNIRVMRGLYVAAFLLSTASVIACGPFFPNRVIEEGGHTVLRTPVGSFSDEIERIKPPVPPEFKTVTPNGSRWKQTHDADISDLEEALAKGKLSRSKQQGIVRQLEAIRRLLLAYDEKKAQQRDFIRGKPMSPPLPELTLPAIPKGLPGEFDDYLSGAILYHKEDMQGAIKVWQALLQRPKEQRRYRSTWAAFMIGRSASLTDPALAVKSFEQTRQLARDGFVDRLGLAASSLGWEARVSLEQGQYSRALELYVVQLASGDMTAMPSLQISSARVSHAGAKALENVAANDTARALFTAYVISRGGRFGHPPADLAEDWLTAIETAGVPRAHEADRLAWTAYQAGRIGMAKRWLTLSPQDSVIVRWLRSKILLREGRMAEAAELLGELVREFPVADEADPAGEWYGMHDNYLPSINSVGETVRGELAVLKLSGQQYRESLDLLQQGGYWEDAAYVAERVLTVDELKDIVDRTRQGEAMQYLLARRLTRLGRWKEARPYYPAKWQGRLDAYVQAIREGHNRTYSQSQRAAFLWEAAIMAKNEGMELLGTELEPDWFLYEGTFERHPISRSRAQDVAAKVAATSEDERRRIQTPPAQPNTRFHYRYIAADHAWQATELMPDRSEDTARKLCIAGTWLKGRDPKAADRFYKALVNRCGNTPLGKEADRIRWFPKLEELDN